MVNKKNQPVTHLKKNNNVVWLYHQTDLIGCNIFQAGERMPELNRGYLYPVSEILAKFPELNTLNYDPSPSFVVAKIQECEDIPNTHLHRCLVDVGEEKPLQIVCGAQNARVGLVTVCAKLGAMMPDGTTITPGTLMGFSSSGMLCSARELNLKITSEGILELNNSLQPGTQFDLVYQNLNSEIEYF